MARARCASCGARLDGIDDPTAACPRCGGAITHAKTDAEYVLEQYDVRAVAQGQRQLIKYASYLVCIMIVAIFVVQVLGIGERGHAMLVVWCAVIIPAVGAVRLLQIADEPRLRQVLTAVLMLIPVVNFFVLLSVNGLATSILTRAGLHVGYEGVSEKEVDRLLGGQHCAHCGAELDEGDAAVCPDCGKLADES
jgi:DNA-directed RNA polymerase subunit RPC12/RpoP